MTIIHQGIESFDQNSPEFNRQSCIEGWQYFIKESLFSFLNKVGNAS